MTMRTEKELRAELADKKLDPSTVDLLVKAEKEKGRLKEAMDEEDDGEESEEDEAKAWDAHGEAIAKAKEAAANELAKAEKVRVDCITVSDPFGQATTSPEQRTSTERTPIDPDIDDITPDETIRDIAKAINDASGPRFDALAKAVNDGLRKVVGRLEARLNAQDALINAVLSQNTQLTKAARRQGKASRDIAKALDLTPAPRRPAYTINDVQPLPRPGDPAPRSAKISIDDLSGWISDELEKAASTTSDLAQRQRIETLHTALGDLDAGTRNPDQIAKAIGYPKV